MCVEVNVHLKTPVVLLKNQEITGIESGLPSRHALGILRREPETTRTSHLKKRPANREIGTFGVFKMDVIQSRRGILAQRGMAEGIFKKQTDSQS